MIFMIYQGMLKFEGSTRLGDQTLNTTMITLKISCGPKFKQTVWKIRGIMYKLKLSWPLT